MVKVVACTLAVFFLIACKDVDDGVSNAYRNNDISDASHTADTSSDEDTSDSVDSSLVPTDSSWGSNNDSGSACELIDDFPCLLEDCCPEGCYTHRGTIVDLEDECLIGRGSHGCLREGYVQPAHNWYCSKDGTYGVVSDNTLTPDQLKATDLVPCMDQMEDMGGWDFSDCE